MSVGSACALLCDEKTAYQLTDHPCEVFICGGIHTLRVADRRSMDIPLLPNETPGMYKNLLKEGSRWSGFESFRVALVRIPGFFPFQYSRYRKQKNHYKGIKYCYNEIKLHRSNND
jgi:hypothetical protein